MNNQFQLILCIVNAGFTELVMDAAKAAGATGGTVLGARGTANKEAEAFFHITIQPEKEMVMILVPTAIRDNVLHALYTNAGIDTPGQGIAFSLPVDDVVGLGTPKIVEQESETAKEESEENKEAEEPKRKKWGLKRK